MKRILFFLGIFIISASFIYGQQRGIGIFTGPAYSVVKFNDFNTFAKSYNDYNSQNLEGFDKYKSMWPVGADIFLDNFYFGFYYSSLTQESNPIVLTAISNRMFDLRLRNYVFNMGWNKGRKKLSITPYASIGVNNLDLDAYVKYYDKYKSYGNYMLDGTYSGSSMLLGFGAKMNFFLKPFFASLGVSKLYSVMPTAKITDHTPKNGYKNIGLIWNEFIYPNTDNYSGAYMSAQNKQFYVQLSLGIYLGKVEGSKH